MASFPASLFTFAGRLDRLRYLGHTLGWALLIIILAVLAAEVFDLTTREGESLLLWDEQPASIALLATASWTLASLTVLRLRDMGFDTRLGLALIAAITLLDLWILPELTTQRLPAPFETWTPLGALLSLGSMLWLLLWPSAPRE